MSKKFSSYIEKYVKLSQIIKGSPSVQNLSISPYQKMTETGTYITNKLWGETISSICIEEIKQFLQSLDQKFRSVVINGHRKCDLFHIPPSRHLSSQIKIKGIPCYQLYILVSRPKLGIEELSHQNLLSLRLELNSCALRR